jgi:C4-dicarboxylate transporter
VEYVEEGDLLILKRQSSNKSTINAIVSGVTLSDAEFLKGMKCDIAVNMDIRTCHVFPQTDVDTGKETLVVYIYPKHKSQDLSKREIKQTVYGHYNILQIIKGEKNDARK